MIGRPVTSFQRLASLSSGRPRSISALAPMAAGSKPAATRLPFSQLAGTPVSEAERMISSAVASTNMVL